VSRVAPRAVPRVAVALGTPDRVAEPTISSAARVETVTAAMYAVALRATPPNRTPVSRRRTGAVSSM
jgi:hypothetical protein